MDSARAESIGGKAASVHNVRSSTPTYLADLDRLHSSNSSLQSGEEVAPAAMLNAEQTNMEGACEMAMRPLVWIWWTTSGRSPGDPSTR